MKLLTLCLALFASSLHALNCSVSQKNDCGFFGITKDQCITKGCCWQEDPGHPYCFFSGGSTCQLNFTYPSAPFTEQQISLMLRWYLKNINIGGKGGILASPDTTVPGGGSYYFHWARDGALTMRDLQDIGNARNMNITAALKSYVQFVIDLQGQKDQFGIDVRIEPKRNLPNGDIFTGGWCRPQTDAPALRAVALMKYARSLLDASDNLNDNRTGSHRHPYRGSQSNSARDANQAYVKQFLWTADQRRYNGGAIKYDLDWVADNYNAPGCDLWEEIQSNDFFWNKFNFFHALLEGNKFSAKMGDDNSAKRYWDAAMALKPSVAAHYNGFYVFQTAARLKDAAVINAFNNGFSDLIPIFGPTSQEVAGTVSTYNQLFCNMFSINNKDTANGIPGILYGRYDGDHYGGGNPWILTSAALAELFYRGATHTLKHGIVLIDCIASSSSTSQWQGLPESAALSAWGDALGVDRVTVLTLTKRDFATKLANAGNSVLYRINYHTAGNQSHLPEQLNRDTGYGQSATDLTWSYSATLKALYWKSQFDAL